MPGTDRVPPPLLVLIGTGTVQVGAATATTLFVTVGPSGTSLLRIALAALILVVIWRPSLRGRSAAAWRAVWVFGACLGLMNLAFYNAIDRLPLGTTVTVEFIGPLGLAIWLSRRRVDYALAAVAAVGIVLLSEPWGDGIDAIGLLLAIAAGVCWAGYILAAQHAGRLFSSGDGVALATVVAIIPSLVPGIATAGAELLSAHALMTGLLVALLSSVIPYTVETEALRRMDARVFGVLMSLEPAVAALAGWIVIAQRPDLLQAAGIALVVVASIGVTRSTVEPEV